MSTLTDEQRARIAANKRQALERRAQKDEQLKRLSNPPPNVLEAKKSKMETEQSSTLLNSIDARQRSVPISSRVNKQILMPPPKQLFAISSTGNNQFASSELSSANPNIQPQQPPTAIRKHLQPLNGPLNLSKPTAPGFDPLKGYKPKVKIVFEIASPTEVQITFEPYVQSIKELLTTFKSARFKNNASKKWTIGLSDYKLCFEKLSILKSIQSTITEIPKWVLNIFDDKSTINKASVLSLEEADKLIAKSNIDECLLKVLFPYQRIGVAFGLQKKGRLLIADEMGLGKTLQALAISRAYTCDWPLLIVCPSSVKHSWKQAIQRFLPNLTDITIIDKGTDRIPNNRSVSSIIIMSYDMMVNKERDLLAANIYVIIFDESHLLKEVKARRTKVAMELAESARRIILLSGTPALSRPAELFTQIKIIDSRIFTNWVAYAKRYCNWRKGRYGYEAKGAENLDELSAILQHAVMIRRLKKDVLDDLPEKTREILYLSGDKIRKALDALELSREAYTQAEKSGNGEQKQTRLMTYFAETGSAKADCVADWIIDTYFYKEAQPVKILLFAHHTAVMDVFSMRFERAKIKTIRIDGSTKDREQCCKRFQENPEVSIAILSITAAGTGITLTAANKVIFAELYWNPGIFFQAEDRAHRVGQKSAVSVLYILARNTADDKIWPKIQEKIMVIGNLNLNREKLDELDNQELVMNGIAESQMTIKDFFTVIEQ